MKKALLSLTVIGSLILSGCEKEEFVPAEQAKIKNDDSIMCRGCGDWDTADPEEESSARAASTTTSTDSARVIKPKKDRK